MLGPPVAFVGFELPVLPTCSGTRSHLPMRVGGALRVLGVEGSQCAPQCSEESMGLRGRRLGLKGAKY